MKRGITLFAFTAIFLFVIFVPFKKVLAFDWPSHRMGPDNNAVVFDVNNMFKTNVSDLIALDLGNPNNLVRPIIGGGKIFISSGTNPSTVRAISLATGQTLWTKTYTSQVTKVFFYNNFLYISSNLIAKLNPETGDEVFRITKDSANKAIPGSEILQIADGKIYAIKNYIGPSFLFILSADDGRILSDPNKAMNEYVPTALIGDNQFYVIRQSRTSASTQIEAFDASYNSLWISSVCPAKAGSAMLDKANNAIHLASTDGRICGYNATTGSSNYVKLSNFAKYFVKYGDVNYSTYGFNLLHFDARDTAANIVSEQVLLNSQNDGQFSSSPIVVNGVLYATTDKGKILAKNLETGAVNKYTISTGNLDNIIYADGKFVIQETSAAGKKMYIYGGGAFDLQPKNFAFKLASPYKNDDSYNEYLGQTHCHYIPDVNWMNLYRDGMPILPAETILKYKGKGYDFVALTEHNTIVPMPVVDGILQIQNAEESTQGWMKHHILALGITEHFDPNLDDQSRIKNIVTQGGIPIFAHPDSWVYGAPTSLLEKYAGLHFLEGFNTGVRYSPIPDANALSDADYLLSRNKSVFITAGDDYTPGNMGFDDGAIVVLSPDNTQASIINNMKAGNFYAVQGSQAPRIKVTANEKNIIVFSNKVSDVKFIGKGGATLREEKNVTLATYEVSGDEIYVRAEVKSDGKTSWSQPIFVEKQILTPSNSGERIINLEQALLKTNISGDFSAETVSAPETAPPVGYLSPVYSFQSNNQVNQGTELNIHLPADLGFDASKVSIYTYDETNKKWNKVITTVDDQNQLAKTELQHFSLYTLSAELPTETAPPTIAMIAPSDLNNLSDNAEFKFNALDESGVTSVRAYLDDIPQSVVKNDLNFSSQINFNNFPTGNHTFKIKAEDFFGNATEQSFTTTSISNFVSPVIVVTAPTENSYVNGSFQLAGNVENSLPGSSLSIGIDDVNLANKDLLENAFIFDLDTTLYKEGPHIINLIYTDSNGNAVQKDLPINFGVEAKAEILSPANESYNHAKKIPITISATPSDLSYELKLDDKPFAGDSILLRDLSLGDHKLSVHFKGSLLDDVSFSIQTSIADQLVMVQKLSNQKHINFCIATQLRLLLIKSSLRRNHKNVKDLQEILNLLNKEANKKKPHIDSYARNIISSDINYLINNL